MKTTLKNLFLMSLLFAAATTVSAQCAQVLEDHMDMLITEASESKVEVTKSISLERDVQKEGAPLQWRCDIYQFSLPKKKRELLDRMKKSFEEESHDNPNCYGVNSMSESSDGDTYGNLRNLMIGEDPNRYVTIGQDYNNFLNINILDAADSAKTHRYAYALEWREVHKGGVDVRYIVTYAKIPSATATITQPSWPYLDLGRSRIIRKSEPKQAENSARAYWLGDGRIGNSRIGNVRIGNGRMGDNIIISRDSVRIVYDGKSLPLDSAQSIIRLTNEKYQLHKNYEDHMKKMNDEKVFWNGHQIAVAWNDTLEHATDPVTDVVSRLHQGQPITSDDLLCNDNILLIFSQLKQQFLAGQNIEFNAISIYTLCKRAREYGFFTSIPGFPNDKSEVEQLKREVILLIDKTTDVSIRNYLQMALAELEKIS